MWWILLQCSTVNFIFLCFRQLNVSLTTDLVDLFHFFFSFFRPVVQSGENILFTMRDQKVTTTIQIAYSGEAEDFSWVLPLPNTPESFDVASDAVFRALHATTQPLFTMTYNTNCSRFNECNVFYERSGMIELDADDGGDTKVKILLTGNVGPFTYTVIAATESDKTGAALFSWLNENKFGIPEIAMPVVARYVRLKYRFATLKLQKGKSSGELVPIVIRYKAPSELDMSCVPLRLTAVAAVEMPVYVWIAGDHRAVPQNFVHLTPDFRKLPWVQCAQQGISGSGVGAFSIGGAFSNQALCAKEYNDLLKATAAEFGAQKWLTTDFAGPLPTGLLDLIYNPNVLKFDKAKLAAASTAQEFLSLAIGALPLDLRTSPVMLALLREFIPKPANVGSECADDRSFYAIGGSCLEDVDDFDAKAMANAIEARLIAPTRNARTELEKFPYMTRFYGVFAPQNMVRDPIFRFVKNTALPNVDRTHSVRASFECTSETFDVTLQFDDKSTRVVSGVKLGQFCGIVAPTDAPVPVIVDDTSRIEVLQAEGADGKLAVKRLSMTNVTVEDDALSSLDGAIMGAAFDPNFCNLGGKGCSCLAGSCGVSLACNADTNKCEIAASSSLFASGALVIVASLTHMMQYGLVY
jgi:hypothetical protein